MDDWLTLTDVADLLGIKPETLRSYRTHSTPGGRYERHPFPNPDERVGNNLMWKSEREAEIREWGATRPGQGVGGGQPAHKTKQVHHLDGDPRNNDPGNLEVREQPEG